MDTKIQRILVGISGTSRKVLATATEIAHKSKASVDLVTVVRPVGPAYGLSAAEATMSNRAAVAVEAKRLEKLAAPLLAAGLSVDCHVELNPSITEGMLKSIDRFKPSLVAIEAHKHNVLARLFLTQTDYNLIRHCPVPLLIVKNSGRRRSKILAALDPIVTGSKLPLLDAEIAAAAHGFAHLLRGAVHGAHVYSPIMGFVGDATFAPVAIPVSLPEERQYVARIRKSFRSFCSRSRIKPGNVHLRMGDPIFVLPKLARSMKARMVVMGAVSRSALQRAFIGSTAEHVLDVMPCDVLIVKAPAASAVAIARSAKAA